MKKLTVGILVAVIIGSLCITACGSNGSTVIRDTYEGAVSQNTYESVEEAVNGFLEEEVSGAACEVELVSYTAEEQLSEEKIASLSLSEEDREGLISVEKGKVEYAEKQVDEGSLFKAAVAAETDAPVTFFKTVYILSYTDMFRFFTPALANGEELTKSYFDSTFVAEKYINCTMDVTMENSQTSQGITRSYMTHTLAKATQSALYEHDIIDSSIEMYVGEGEVFMLDSPKGIVEISQKKGEKPMLGGILNHDVCNTINQYFMQWFNSRFGQLDHTYFEKTETGYALRSDRYEGFLKAMGMLDENGEYQLEYVINIVDGRMSEFKMTISSTTGWGTDTQTMSCRFSDFGTTVIEVPAAVSEIYNSAIAQ